VTVLLSLLLCMVLPGIAGGVFLTWFSPDPSRPGGLLTRALGCGVVVWLVSSGVLVRTVGLTATSAWITDGLLAVGSGALLSAPRSRNVLRLALPELQYLAALLVVTAVAWFPVGFLVLRTTWGPIGSTPWYYWSLAAKIARAGHVPSHSTEWGTKVPFLDDYHLFSTGTAYLLTQDSASVRVLQTVTVVSAVLLACGAALVANSFGVGRLASLAAVPIAVATGVGAARLSAYRPEGFAFGLMLLLVAMLVDWLRHGERGSLVAGCLLAAVLSQVHGIALTTGGILLVASAITLYPRDRPLPYLRQCALTGLAVLGSVLVLGVALGVAPGTEHAGRLANTSGLADPTWRFIHLIRDLPPSLPPGNPKLAKGAIASVYEGTGIWVGLVAAASLVLLALGARRRQPASRILAFALLSMLGLAAVGAVFAFGWSSYVPRRTGAQRLVAEATLLLGPCVAGALACLRLSGRLRGRTQLTSICVVVVLCALGVFGSVRLAGVLDRQRPPPSAVQALVSLDVPPRAVVLTNAYTEGYVKQVTGAHGLIDGRAPYTFPSVLRRANSLIRQAKQFYLSPRRHAGFLDREHVSYVVVSGHSYSLGTGNLYVKPTEMRGLNACPRLKPVLLMPGLRVYHVRPAPR
jgi:hypothetical protein